MAVSRILVEASNILSALQAHKTDNPSLMFIKHNSFVAEHFLTLPIFSYRPSFRNQSPNGQVGEEWQKGETSIKIIQQRKMIEKSRTSRQRSEAVQNSLAASSRNSIAQPFRKAKKLVDSTW